MILISLIDARIIQKNSTSPPEVLLEVLLEVRYLHYKPKNISIFVVNSQKNYIYKSKNLSKKKINI